jgi:hypothetical protein
MKHAVKQLMWTVQALAQPAETQPHLFPPFVVVADELALEFDAWYRTVWGEVRDTWLPAQRDCLATLNSLLTEMSGPDKPELWLEPDCLQHPR